MDRIHDNARFDIEMQCGLVVEMDSESKAFGCVNNFHEANQFVSDFREVRDFDSPCGFVGRVGILYVSQVASYVGDLVRAASGIVHRAWPVTWLRVHEDQAKWSDYKVQGYDSKVWLYPEKKGKARRGNSEITSDIVAQTERAYIRSFPDVS